MSRNSVGTYALPLPNVQTGTVISSTWANTSLTDIAAEMTNSLSRDGFGSMRAPLRVPDGSAPIPSLSFNNDAASGLYLNAASDVRMAIASTGQMKWLATGTVALQAFSAEKGSTFTNSTSNGAAITATGNGSGAGGVFTGGATGNGVTASGGGTSGVGGAFTGVGASAGVTGAGGATNATGVVGTASGTGTGVSGTGGSSGSSTSTGIGVLGTGGGSGPGVRGVGGAGGSGGDGVVAIGSGTAGRGVNALGGTGQPGGLFTAGTSATSGTPQNAITLNAGYLNFSSTTEPASNTGILNALPPKGLTKLWAKVGTTGAGGVNVNGGMNVTAAISGAAVRFTLVSPLADTNYAVTITGNNTDGTEYYVTAQTTSTFDVSAYTYSLNGPGTAVVTSSVSLATNIRSFFVHVNGVQ